MKLSLTHYDRTVSVETERDDVNLDEVLEMAEDLLRGAGFPVVSGSLSIDEDGPTSSCAVIVPFPEHLRRQ